MAENTVQQVTAAEVKTAELQTRPAQTLEQSLDALYKFGGFDFLEDAIDGVKTLNPERKALRKIFLTDDSKKGERESLKKKLALWLNLVSESSDLEEMVAK